MEDRILQAQHPDPDFPWQHALRRLHDGGVEHSRAPVRTARQQKDADLHGNRGTAFRLTFLLQKNTTG